MDLVDLGVQCYLGLPLQDSSGQVIGHLVVMSERTVRFDSHMESILRLFAARAGAELERKQAEEKLCESDRQLRLTQFAVDQAADAIVWADDSQRLVYANEAACGSLGYSHEELRSLTIADIAPHHEQKKFRTRLERLMRGETLQYESLHRTKDGRVFPVDISVNYVTHEGAGYTCAIARDITDRKQAEEALRYSELRYRIVARTTHDAIWDWDIIRNSLEWNDGIQTLFGYEPDAIGPDLAWWIENIHPEDRTRVVNEVHAIVDGGESIWTSEYQFRCSDGTYAIVADRGYVLHDETGKSIRMAGAMHDITERKQAEFALRQSEDRYRDVLTNIPALVAVVDKKQRFQLINKQYEDFLGLPSDQILGKFMREVVGGSHYEQLKENIEVVLSGKSTSFEMESAPGNGERRRWLDVSYVPDYDQAGEVQGFFVLVSDITERRQAQNQLRELSRQLRRAEEVERQKVARELHDEFGQLLTVLKMDLGWLDVALIQNQSINKAKFSDKFTSMKTVLDQAIDSVRRVTSLLRPEVLDTLGIFSALEFLCRDFQGRTNISCVVSAGSGIQGSVMDDERSHALFRITQEFLTNVVRHANASEVHITISVQGGNIILDLQDNGIGISPDRIHSTTTLGLLGMKERTEMLGGRFTIVGKPGEGTHATVSLPLENQFMKRSS